MREQKIGFIGGGNMAEALIRGMLAASFSAERIWVEDEPDVMFVYTKAIDEFSHFFYRAGVPEAAELGWSEAEIDRYGSVVDRSSQDPRTVLPVRLP